MSDGAGDFSVSVSDVQTMMDEYWRLQPAKAQFTRHTKSARWFRAGGEIRHKGDIFHYKLYTAPTTMVRKTTIGTAETSEFPRARKNEFIDVGVPYSDMKVLQATVKFNDLAVEKTKDTAHAVYNVANRYLKEVDNDFAETSNKMIHQATTSKMAAVAEKYDPDGSSYSATKTQAYISIDEGQIGQFHRGQILDIRTAATATVRLTVEVDAVNIQNDGPVFTGFSSRVADIGPGLVCSYYAAEGTGAEVDFDAVVDGDVIVMSGEGVTSNVHGLPDWMSETTNVYKGADGSTEYDRDDPDYYYAIPEMLDFTSGTPVELDLDVHLRELADILPNRVQTGRMARQANTEGINLKESLVAISTPRIINAVVDEGLDSRRFTSMSTTSMDAGQRRNLIGESGFDGYVWHNPTLGPIAFQEDVMARPNIVELLDATTFFWLYIGDGVQSIKWLDNNGTRFDRVRGTNNRQTYHQDAGAWTALSLQNDQIGANAEIQGVKSGLY